MKRLLLVLLTITTISSTFAQDTEKRMLRHFSKIIAYDGVSVQLVPSDENYVKISGDDIEKVVTQVTGDKLKIKMSFGSNFRGENNHIVVYFKEIPSEIKATEGSSITSNHVIEIDHLLLESKEGADISLEISSKNLTAKIVTGGEMNIKGKSKNTNISLATGGRFDGKKLVSEYAEASVTTGGTVMVNVEKVLDASVTMGGSIYYYGDTQTVNDNISLGGTIAPRN